MAVNDRKALEELLASRRRELLLLVRQFGRGLLRYEGKEDLFQGICLHALEGAGRFEYRSEPEGIRWLEVVARQHLANRAQYWRARKRDGGRMLRLIDPGGGSLPSAQAVDPPDSTHTASSFAVRRERRDIAARAISLLPPRDQELLHLTSGGLPLEAIARKMDLSYTAVQRARVRALERFRKVFLYLSGESPPSSPPASQRTRPPK